MHCLHSLQRAGIERAVVVLGVGAEKLVSTIKLEIFSTLVVEFLWGVEFNWGTSLANNISALARTEPPDCARRRARSSPDVGPDERAPSPRQWPHVVPSPAMRHC